MTYTDDLQRCKPRFFTSTDLAGKNVIPGTMIRVCETVFIELLPILPCERRGQL